jgi:tetratricopeptide (TPR) repeat protein
MKNKKENKRPAPVSIIKNNLIVYLIFLVVVPFVLYFRVVNFEYSGLDDVNIIQNITNAQGSPLNLKEAFKHDNFMSNDGIKFYRPITTISFMLDALWGGIEPWTYHLSNLIFYLLNVIALFFFLNKTGIKEEISFLLSLLFSVNPIFSNVVAWIPARGDLLLCLFSLLSFMTFIEYFKNGKKVYLILHVVVIAVAIFSKESAVLLPAILLLYYYFVLKKKFRLKEISPFLIGWFIIIVIFYSLRQSVIKASLYPAEFGIIPFIKNLPAIPIIFFKFFIPYKLCTMPLFDNTGIIGGIILFAIFAALIIKIIPTERRMVIWGGAWFLAFSIPPMFFRTIPPVGYEYLEFRTYLPIIGILLISGFIINKLSTSISFKKMLMISIPILLIYSVIAFFHTMVFADTIAFFTSAINTNSNNASAFCQRGVSYYYRGRNDLSLSDLDNSIRICPTYPIPYSNMGMIYSSLNDHYKAEYFFSQALKYDTLDREPNRLEAKTYIYLSREKIILRKYDEAKGILKKGIIIYPENADLHNNFGMLYFSVTKFDSALYEYNKAIEFKKGNALFYSNRGLAEYNLNNFADALNDFNRTLELNPDFLDAWENRGMSKIKLNDNEGAIYDFNKVISLNPQSAESYYYRGEAYSKLNKPTEAGNDWAIARNLGYKAAYNEKQKEK